MCGCEIKEGNEVVLWLITAHPKKWAAFHPRHICKMSISSKRSPLEALWLLPGAPLVVVKSVYKALARICHPDMCGDTQTMQKLNEAYELILKEYK